MIVKFVQIKDDSGYYDPSAQVKGSNRSGAVVYGFSLREIYLNSENVSHFYTADKYEKRRKDICNQLELSEEASYTQIFLKHGPTKNIVVVGDASYVHDRLEGVSSGKPRK